MKRHPSMQDFGGKHHDDILRGEKRSRPTTPLRPSSISSFRDSARDAGKDAPSFPLNTFEPAFTELSDGLADLEANMMHFQLMHESLSRFSESFASFLYGLNMNAFCADFPEGPILESFGRSRGLEENSSSGPDADFEATFMTTDTSFINNPPTSTKTQPKSTTGASRQSRLPFVKGQSTAGTLIRRTRGGRSKPLGVRGRTAS